MKKVVDVDVQEGQVHRRAAGVHDMYFSGIRRITGRYISSADWSLGPGTHSAGIGNRNTGSMQKSDFKF